MKGTGQTGGYDAWGVRFPTGKIREFSTQEKCRMYIDAVNGKEFVQADGSVTRMEGLHIVHRYIPKWERVD